MHQTSEPQPCCYHQQAQACQLPPFSQLALFRAEALQPQAALEALQAIAALFPTVDGATVLGPMSAVMERRAGKYRYQLLLQCRDRALRSQLLRHILPRVEGLVELRRVRWSLDVDPQDFS